MDSIEINKIYKAKRKSNKQKTQLGLSGKGKLKTNKDKGGKSIKSKEKTNKLSRSKLVKKLDHIFSQYIRLLYADKNGMVRCVTSGDLYHWKKIQNGHFISRGNYKYRWDEKNCYPQCYVDNCIKNGNYKEYTLFMIHKHGQIVVENMINDKEVVKISTSWIQDQILHYTKCVKELLDSKGL